MASSQNKLTKERNQRQLLEIAAIPGNTVCADCKARVPRWASHNLGIFICVNCASIHRKMGVHISKVKSLTMDEWTREQIEFMRSMGNEKSNSIYNPNELRNPPPPDIENNERDSEIEQYIRSKYEYKKFMDKSALVASKLGPSRSASSVMPRSVPSNSSQNPTTSQSSSNTRSTATTNPNSFSFASSLPSSSSNPSIPRQPWSIPPSIPAQSSMTVQQQKELNSRNDLLSMLDDLNDMIGPEKSSTLPLQYKQPQPHVNGAIGQQGYPVGVTSAGTGMNPFAHQQLGINPYSHQGPQSPFAPPPFGSQNPQQPAPVAPANPQSYASGGQPFGIQSGPLSSMGGNGFSQPVSQPQPSMQNQASSFIPISNSQGFMSPSHSNPSQYLSPSPSAQFISSSPSSNFLSSSPNTHFPSSSPNTQFLTSSSSQPFGSHNPQSQMQMQQHQNQGQLGFPTSMSQPIQTGQFAGGNMSGHGGQSQFSGMTTMQMQQQQLLLQQQQERQRQQQQQQQQEQQRQQQQQMQMQLQIQQQQEQHQQQMQMQQLLQQQQQQQFAQQGMYGSNMQPQQQQMYGGLNQMFPQGGGGGYSSGQGGQWGGM